MTQMPANSTPEKMDKGKESEDIREGWVFKSSGKLDDAEVSFRRALLAQPDSVEGHYGLALTLKLQGRRQESIKTFEKVIDLIESGFPDKVRGRMLLRLCKGHINMLSGGDWNLEKEIWKREQ